MKTELRITGFGPHDIFSVADVAALLDRSRGWIHAQIGDGKISSQKVGAGRVITGADFADYLGTFYSDFDCVIVDFEGGQ